MSEDGELVKIIETTVVRVIFQPDVPEAGLYQ